MPFGGEVRSTAREIVEPDEDALPRAERATAAVRPFVRTRLPLMAEQVTPPETASRAPEHLTRRRRMIACRVPLRSQCRGRRRHVVPRGMPVSRDRGTLRSEIVEPNEYTGVRAERAPSSVRSVIHRRAPLVVVLVPPPDGSSRARRDVRRCQIFVQSRMPIGGEVGPSRREIHPRHARPPFVDFKYVARVLHARRLRLGRDCDQIVVKSSAAVRLRVELHDHQAVDDLAHPRERQAGPPGRGRTGLCEALEWRPAA